MLDLQQTMVRFSEPKSADVINLNLMILTMKNNNKIRLGGRMQSQPNQIMMLKADINYTIVLMTDGSTFYSSTNIGKLESRLKEHHFFRPNRSIIINLQYIKDFESETCQVRMENDETVIFSRRKWKKINEDFDMLFEIS
jgi:DNA-binding LytR/AlgR family response regulator